MTSTTSLAGNGGPVSATAYCASGKVVLGGGGSSSTTTTHGPFIAQSVPLTTGTNGWRVTWAATAKTTAVLTVYAICSA